MNSNKILARTSDSAYLESGTNLGWQLSLCSAQYDIEKFLRRGNWLDVLPSGLHGGQPVYQGWGSR